METKMRNFSRVVVLAMLSLLSCALFVPTVRDAIIAFGERIVGRELNHGVWHKRFIIGTLFVFAFLLPAMLVASNKLSIECYFVISLLIIDVLFICRANFDFCDFYGQRNLCAYALRGINPFPLVGTSVAPIASLGDIPCGFATAPWGLLLGNVFYSGILPFFAAKTYFVMINVVAVCAVALSMVAKLKGWTKHLFLYVALVLFSYLFWTAAVVAGNCGGIVCCLLILAMLWHTEFPVLSGVVLAFAMVKPQVAGLICLAFLLNGRFKSIVVAAVVDVLAWIAVAVMVRTSPLQLLADFFAVKTGNGNSYMGIFTPLAGLIPYEAVLPLSMAAGIAFVVLMHILQKDKSSPLRMFFPACVATTFWCYAWANDAFILIVPTFLCLSFMENAEHFKERIFWFLCAACFYARHFVCDFVLIIFRIFIKSEHCWWYQLTLYSLGLIAVSLIMLKKLRGSGNAYDGSRV